METRTFESGVNREGMEGTMSINELRAATDQAVAAEIRSIEARLMFLRGEVPMFFAPAQTVAPHVTLVYDAAAKPKTKRRKVSPRQAESRRIQGVYLSLIRRVPKSFRPQYQFVAKRDGRLAAIQAMRANS